MFNSPPALYRLMERIHTGEKRPRMGFLNFRKSPYWLAVWVFTLSRNRAGALFGFEGFIEYFDGVEVLGSSCRVSPHRRPPLLHVA